MILNKVIFISGATDGIGLATAAKALEKGLKVVLHGKNEDRVKETSILLSKQFTDKNIVPFIADFAHLQEIPKAVENLKKQISKIDILLNNAATIEDTKKITENGFEMCYQVNYSAHFLMTLELLPLLKNAEKGKIFNVSSMIHAAKIDFDNLQCEQFYDKTEQYAVTKLLNILHAYKLSELFACDNLSIHALHPGVIATKLLRTAWSGGAPPETAAEMLMYLFDSPVAEMQSALYFENGRPMQSTPISYDKNVQNRLWDLTLEQLNKAINYDFKI